MSCSTIKTGGSMRRIGITVFLLFFLVEAISGTKKEFWEEKDYKQWSAQECSKILNNSPWTQMITDSANSSIRDGDERFSIQYTAQLQSALPVRKALVRKDQIQAKYDTLSAEQKMAFDQQSEALLSQTTYSDKIVVMLKRTTTHVGLGVELDNFWQTYLHKNYVFLSNDRGVKTPLLSLQSAGGKSRILQLVFSRQVGGKDIINSQDINLILEFRTEKFGIHQDDRSVYKAMASEAVTQTIRFNVKKMMINGELQY
jgi:hypothetical protein